MGYMRFKNGLLESSFRQFKFSRNNTIEIFLHALDQEIVNFVPTDAKVKEKIQPILFQFQCLVTTTDAYYRKIANHKNKNYGILIENGQIVKKDDIATVNIEHYLKKQLIDFEQLLKEFNDKKAEKNIGLFTRLSNHEYLHQGQLILMFRLAGATLPKRFVQFWAL